MSYIERNKEKLGLVISILIFMCMQGCATTRTHWQPSLRECKDVSETKNKNMGVLQDENFLYNVIITDFGKVNTTIYPGKSSPEMSREPKTFMTVVIRCYNKSKNAAILKNDPIQMIDVSKTLVRKLTPDEVIYKLYGGKVKDRLQRDRLKDLKEPISTNSTLFGELLAVIDEVTREQERSSIINDMFKKEDLLYQTLHESFEPVSLPSGVAVDWVQYYDYTHGDIHVLLEGQNVSDGRVFTSLPPPPLKYNPPTTNQLSIDSTSIVIGVAVTALIIIAAYDY